MRLYSNNLSVSTACGSMSLGVTRIRIKFFFFIIDLASGYHSVEFRVNYVFNELKNLFMQTDAREN